MNKQTYPRPPAVGATKASNVFHECEQRDWLALVGTLMLGLSCLIVISSPTPARGMTTPVDGPTGDFANASLKGWKERSFARYTDYELVEEQGNRVLKAHTDGKASILYTEQNVNLKNTPVIEWSWKVDRTYLGINERSRQGDDFPARLYVVAKTGFLPWETLAINYVWSADAPLGDSWANPLPARLRW